MLLKNVKRTSEIPTFSPSTNWVHFKLSRFIVRPLPQPLSTGEGSVFGIPIVDNAKAPSPVERAGGEVNNAPLLYSRQYYFLFIHFGRHWR
jgi:hypothetical protein